MLHSKWYKDWIRPDEAAMTWKFTMGGLLRWMDTDFTGMKFVHRDYFYNPDIIKNYVKTPGFGVVLELDGNHWGAVWDWGIRGPVIFDPINGHILWRWQNHYKSITGFALFNKTV